jgi:hypothetical protein
MPKDAALIRRQTHVMASRFVRTQWWPPLPLVCLTYLVFRAVMAGLTTFRLVGILVRALWSILAIYNHLSGGAFPPDLSRRQRPHHPLTPLAQLRAGTRRALGTSSVPISPYLRQPSDRIHVFGHHTIIG